PPTDGSFYSMTQAVVSLTVAKATPAIAWPTPDPIVSGSPLSAIQLDATASVLGSFDYTPAVGDIPEPGTHTLSVTFTPTDTLNYTTAKNTVSLTATEIA